MAHLWTDEAGSWEAQRIGSEGLDLPANSALQSPSDSSAPAIARIIRTEQEGTIRWALIAPPNSAVCVNSYSLTAGLRVLDDRDQIRIGSQLRYFSTETLAAVEQLPATDRPVFCGRCRQQIEVGSPAVRCPGCGVWYNQSAELPCFTYAEHCSFCNHATALDTGFAWTPEED